MIGATAVSRYVAVMAARGCPPDVVLEGSGIHHERLSDPGFLITPAQYRGIIRRLMDVSGEQGIGLADSAFRDLGDLGVVGHASAASRTVRDTYRVWTRFGPKLVGMMGQLRILEEDPRSVTFAVASPDADDPLYQFSVEELLTMVRKVSRVPADNGPGVADLTLSYRMPRHAERYEALLGTRLRFGAPQTTIRVWKEWFDRPSTLHDEEFHTLCLQHCENVLQRAERSRPMVGELRWLLMQSECSCLPGLEAAASRLNVSARTLRRRLRDEGTSYREQLEAFRAERAKQYLAYGTLSPKEIAFALGFREQSAFRHAFKAWTGMTVGEYRHQAAADIARTGGGRAH